jgi:hypothetical protein
MGRGACDAVNAGETLVRPSHTLLIGRSPARSSGHRPRGCGGHQRRVPLLNRKQQLAAGSPRRGWATGGAYLIARSPYKLAGACRSRWLIVTRWRRLSSNTTTASTPKAAPCSRLHGCTGPPAARAYAATIERAAAHFPPLFADSVACPVAAGRHAPRPAQAMLTGVCLNFLPLEGGERWPTHDRGWRFCRPLVEQGTTVKLSGIARSLSL